MRIVYNILILIMLAVIAAAGAWRAKTDKEWAAQVDEARIASQRIEREIKLRATLRDVPLSERGWPISVDPQWFEGGLPRNPLLPEGGRPWLEIADESQEHQRHPTDPVSTHDHQAMFWYNPGTGVVRARVPSQATYAASLELYNTVNGSALRVE